MEFELTRLEADGRTWGKLFRKWRHVNRWDEHIESSLTLWQVCWKDGFALIEQTSISMEDMFIDRYTAENPVRHGGWLTLKYGKNGAITTAFGETQVGKATATGSAQLVQIESGKDGRLKFQTTIILKPKGREPFSLTLWLSVPAGKSTVPGDDVTVDDYLLCHD